MRAKYNLSQISGVFKCMMSSWFAETMGVVTFIVSQSKFAEIMGVISFVVSLCVRQHFSLDSDGKEFSRVHIRRAEVNHEKEENQGSVSIIMVTSPSLIRHANFFVHLYAQCGYLYALMSGISCAGSISSISLGYIFALSLCVLREYGASR